MFFNHGHVTLANLKSPVTVARSGPKSDSESDLGTGR
jgi:hypothetical protein